MNKGKRNFWLDVLIFFAFVVVVITAITIHAHAETDLTTPRRFLGQQSRSIWLQAGAVERVDLLRREEPELVDLGLTRFTWTQLHAGAGLSLLFGIGIHFFWHWNWIKAAFKRSVRQKPKPIRRNRTIDAGLLVVFALICLSGMVMWSAGGADHVTWPGLSYEAWRHLHGITAMVMLVLTIAHLVLHRKWIVITARRYLTGSADGSSQLSIQVR